MRSKQLALLETVYRTAKNKIVAVYRELAIVITAQKIMNVRAPEVPPPGAGLNTVICSVSSVTMSAAVIEAPTCVADT
jgi:hypothetical protein